MHLDDRTVQAHGFDLHADQLLALQLGKQPIQNTLLGPTIHAGVDRMPGAEAFRQRAPLAAVLGDKENRVDHVKVLVRHVASLPRQVNRNPLVLFGCDFHARSISVSVNRP
jgi:hypothetical protein